ncbi:MAG: PAS domain-containing protein [Leptolyngbyaceae cyanobacterium SM2_5_2]|nr:PAS domain-containing protein [Leptolyngbyaceae cyanobacterium SM2_5_2]
MTPNSPAPPAGSPAMAHHEILHRSSLLVGSDGLQGGLKQMLNAISTPICIKDQQHRWLFLNVAFGQLLGYNPGELLGKSEVDLFSAPVARTFLEAGQRVLATGQVQEHQTTITDASGQPHGVLSHTSPLDLPQWRGAADGDLARHQPLSADGSNPETPVRARAITGGHCPAPAPVDEPGGAVANYGKRGAAVS